MSEEQSTALTSENENPDVKQAETGSTRLYLGLVYGDKWYNHTKVHELRGGGLAAFQGKSSGDMLLNVLKNSITHLYTADGEDSIELDDKLYLKMKFVDCFLIAMEAMRSFRPNDKYPVFQEWFRCDVCSSAGNERFTEVNQSWHWLIEEGEVEQIYAEKPEEVRWSVELPVGLQIKERRSFAGGMFKQLRCEHMSIADMMDIMSDPSNKNEADNTNAKWDGEIIAVKGIDDRNFNLYARKVGNYSFTKEYLTNRLDQEAMTDAIPLLGLDATNRKIRCTHCNQRIEGSLDLTNFFDWLLPTSKGRNGRAKR